MTDNEHLNKRDLEIILEVNRKAIEIETNVAEQNEEIVTFLEESKKREEDIQETVDKIKEKVDEINKDLFKIQVLFFSGILSLIIQVVQIFIKK